MKCKSPVYFFILLFLSCPIYGQSIKFGSREKADFQNYEPRIRGEDESSLYVADVFLSDVILESFDKRTLKKNYHKEYRIIPKHGIKSILELKRTLFIDGYFVLFVSGQYFDDSHSELYVHRFKASTGEKESMDTLMYTRIEDLPIISTQQKLANRLGRYQIQASPDKEHIVIHYANLHYEIGRFFEQIVVLDKELQVVKNKEFVQEKESQLIPKGIEVDNEGSIYYIDGNELVFRDIYQDYEEWREPLPTDLFESNASPVDITGAFNPAGNLIVTASYLTEDTEDTDENKEGKETREGDTQIEGMVFLEVDGFNKEIVKAKVSRFDKTFLDEFKDKYHVKRGQEAEFNNILSRFRYSFTDNYTILIGHSVPGLIGTGMYMYGSVVVFCFDEEGTLSWAHRIPKFQIFKTNWKSTLTGYQNYLDDDYLYIFFQDDEDSFEGNKRNVLKLKTLDNNKHAVPVVYKFNLKTGKMEYDLMRRWDTDEKLKLDPHYGYQGEVGEPLYIFGKHKKHYRISRIDLRK